MKTKPLLTAACLALTALLTACTGTEEPASSVRLALLTDGGRTLGYLDTTTDTSVTAATSLTIVENLGDNPGVGGLLTLNTGRNLGLTRQTSLEQRDAALLNPLALPLPPNPCLQKTVLNTSRDRLLTLSDCNGLQQLALYRTDLTPVWQATLPAPTAPIPTSDTPPTRIAALGDTAIVTRAALTGGSEVILVTHRSSSDPVQDAIGVVGTPQPSQSIRDLAAFGGTVYAATDTGVRPLLPTGLPNPAADPASVAAFGTARVDRLWSGVAGSRGLLAAWRDTRLSGNGTEPLRLWDGAAGKVSTAGNFANLRDLAFDLNSQMYLLTPGSLTRYDALLGMQQNIWQGSTLLYNLQDARALTWLVP